MFAICKIPNFLRKHYNDPNLDLFSFFIKKIEKFFKILFLLYFIEKYFD